MAREPSERTLVALVAVIQFISIVEFMMVAPLGPDLAEDIALPTSMIGVVVGSYTLAAALGSLFAARWMDRFDRRAVIVPALLGQGLGTALAAAAWDLPSLVAARCFGGLFAGPATSIALAILMDRVPPRRRGRALGTVMGAFAAASVLGVPAGLELARLGGWRLPFIAASATALALALLARATLPIMREHIQGRSGAGVLALLARPEPRMAYLMILAAVTSGFLLIPFLSTFYQLNLGFPREHIGLLYLAGGAVSFFTMRLTGRWVDRVGPERIALVAVALYVAILYAGFNRHPPWLPVLPLFVLFMVARTTLSVSLNTLITWVPEPGERAAFMSVKTAMQHGAAAVAAFLGSRLLSEGPDGALIGMPTVSLIAIVLASAAPALAWALRRRLNHVH